jgi:acyl phosphate:glycerol-3-phosphate acyltransferase
VLQSFSPSLFPAYAAALAFGYLCGSIPFGLILTRLAGTQDIRSIGSGNIGATNVLRTGNKAAAALTLLGDAAKGWFAVWLAQQVGAQYGVEELGIALVALAVFLGHLWPLYTRFVGGKGVATALGVLLGISPWLGLAVLATWLAVAYLFRYSSLAALVAAVLAPFYYGLLFGFDAKLLAVLVMSALLIYRHSKNIGNLLSGKESRIGSKKK